MSSAGLLQGAGVGGELGQDAVEAAGVKAALPRWGWRVLGVSPAVRGSLPSLKTLGSRPSMTSRSISGSGQGSPESSVLRQPLQ